MQLTNKAALVTGGGRGIGREIALALAGEGADVCVTARSRHEIDDVAAEIEKLGRRALALKCDVSDPESVQVTVDTAAQQLGRLDILVNNAGGAFARQAVADSDSGKWKETIDVNLLGTYYASRAVIAHMRRAGGGKIINVGSGMGHSARAGNSAYNAAKAGVWMLTRCLAMELWEENITVNELVPGPVLTKLTENMFELGKAPPIAPSERVKTPQECVPLALFLATHPPGGPTGQSFSLARRPL